MDNLTPPKPPLMRELKGPYGVLVNEYKTVDWYTEMGKLYPRNVHEDRFGWLSMLFKRDYEIKLKYSLK